MKIHGTSQPGLIIILCFYCCVVVRTCYSDHWYSISLLIFYWYNDGSDWYCWYWWHWWWYSVIDDCYSSFVFICSGIHCCYCWWYIFCYWYWHCSVIYIWKYNTFYVVVPFVPSYYIHLFLLRLFIVTCCPSALLIPLRFVAFMPHDWYIRCLFVITLLHSHTFHLTGGICSLLHCIYNLYGIPLLCVIRYW